MSVCATDVELMSSGEEVVGHSGDQCDTSRTSFSRDDDDDSIPSVIPLGSDVESALPDFSTSYSSSEHAYSSGIVIFCTTCVYILSDEIDGFSTTG